MSCTIKNNGGKEMNTIEDFFTISDFDERIAKNKAEELFNNYYLKRGEYKFYFLEVEFYFFSKNHQDILIKDGKEKPFVYQRWSIFASYQWG